MVTDNQVRRLFLLLSKGKALTAAAACSGMDPKTARKHREEGILPSELESEHSWRTRPDPFSNDWERVRTMLCINPGLQAKTIFEYFQRQSPGKY